MRIEPILRSDLERRHFRHGIHRNCRPVLTPQVSRIVIQNRCQIRRTQTAFHPIHRIGRYQDIRHSVIHQSVFEIIGYLQDNIGIARFDTVHRFMVGRRIIGQFEIAGRYNLLYQSFRHRGTVVIDDAQLHIPHLLVRRPRHDQQHHQRHDNNQLRQKRIPSDLLKLFFYQIFQHSRIRLTGF